MKLKSILAAALAASLLGAPAAFAAGESPSLSYERDENTAILSIQDIEGLDNIYSVQLDFDVAGTFPGVILTPHEPAVFTTHRIESTTSNASTHLTLYFDSLAPLNVDATLTLGILDFGKEFTMPTTADLILLYR